MYEAVADLGEVGSLSTCPRPRVGNW